MMNWPPLACNHNEGGGLSPAHSVLRAQESWWRWMATPSRIQTQRGGGFIVFFYNYYTRESHHVTTAHHHQCVHPRFHRQHIQSYLQGITMRTNGHPSRVQTRQGGWFFFALEKASTSQRHTNVNVSAPINPLPAHWRVKHVCHHFDTGMNGVFIYLLLLYFFFSFPYITWFVGRCFAWQYKAYCNLNPKYTSWYVFSNKFQCKRSLK